MATDWLKAAQRATTPEARRKFMRRHREQGLRITIRECRNCPLNKTRKNAVPWSGKAPKPIVLIGEGPGANEDKQGKPFVGQAGKKLDQMIVAAGYQRDDAIVMNIVCCRPPKNRDPKPEEVAACRPNYVAQLANSGAWTAMLMGNSALKQMRPGTSISEMRGKPFWENGRIWVPTYHPAYVLRNRDAMLETSKDLRLAFDIAYGKAWVPPPVNKALVSTEPDRDLIASELAGQGWTMVYSSRLEDEVIVLQDEHVLLGTKHKKAIAERELIAYTVEEMVRLGEFAAGKRLPTSQLRAVHYLKSLDATVVA